jgi:hypothetical protein
MERLSLQNGGWVRYRADRLPAPVLVRFQEHTGRLVVTELYLEHQGGIEATLLRQVPLGRIEAWANSPEAAGSIRARLGLVVPDLRAAASELGRTYNPKKVTPALVLDAPESRRDHGDDFYRSVARVYGQAAATHRAPATAMAEANHVPVSTVHRWVKEARRRGFLPAGRPGKAG